MPKMGEFFIPKNGNTNTVKNSMVGKVFSSLIEWAVKIPSIKKRESNSTNVKVIEINRYFVYTTVV